jgi:glycosyltransferase involved in cell wall biosynthesis
MDCQRSTLGAPTPASGAPGAHGQRRAGRPSRGRLRVLLCIDALGVGGKERQAVELIKGLTRHPDLESHVICLATDDFYLDQLTGATISVAFATRHMRWDMGLFFRLYRLIRQHQPHVIHTNGLISSFYTLPLARLLGIPLINGSIRNAFDRGDLRWRVERLLARMSDYRVANSFAGLRSRGFAPSEARNVVIYNGFDFGRVASFATTEIPRRDPGHGLLKTVGMVAEFNRFKDYPTFIQTARRLSTKRSDVRFLAVGSGQTLPAGKELAAGVDAITFLGEQKNVEPIVAAFDIGVLATFTEGISNSIMEYMAFRKPVVATDGGGTRELVVDGETGFLVPPKQPDVLAARIDYLLDHPDIARQMGEAGEARLRRKFSTDTMVDQTIRLYERAVAER